MKTNKLFHVLVVGGALLGAQSLRGDATPESPEIVPEEAKLAFCMSDNECTVDTNGKKVAKPGLVCCWGTSCDNITPIPEPE